VSAVDLAVARLKIEEGYRGLVYKDPVGKLTIGYGCNLDAGITPYAASALLTAQVESIALRFSTIPWFMGLDEVRASVLIDLAFNLGVGGLSDFPKMLLALGKQDWTTAHAELLDSDAARQLPTRYGELAQILLTGVA
jgi:lysozyme